MENENYARRAKVAEFKRNKLNRLRTAMIVRGMQKMVSWTRGPIITCSSATCYLQTPAVGQPGVS